MARKCYYTGLGTAYGNNRPHSLQATRRSWKANLQKVRIIDENGNVRREYVSARAMHMSERKMHSKSVEIVNRV